MKSLQYLPLLFEPKIDCLLHTEIRFLESKSTLPQRKKSTTFRRESPISAKTTGNWVETLAIPKVRLFRIPKI